MMKVFLKLQLILDVSEGSPKFGVGSRESGVVKCKTEESLVIDYKSFTTVLQICVSQLPTPDSELPTTDSRLQTPNSMLWTCKIFDFLTPHELYAILQLRNEVFVVEQKCIFQDADNKDQYCHHAMGMLNEKLIAYTRIAPAGLIYEYVSIGRVVTSPDIRGTGIGKKLMKYSIDQVYQLYGKIPIKIGAQLYLKDFYQSFGFLQCSEVYLEDGIEHIKMMMNI